MLTYIVHGEKTDKPSLLIAHGLFGSARNWGAISKALADERQVIAVDMRNHGHSPWYDSHSYPDMAQDLARVITTIGGPMDVLGHSMGGKAAMMLALTEPDLVRHLIVADIAPVLYTHTQLSYVKAMQSVDMHAVKSRRDAAEQLKARVDDPRLIPFFMQSMDVHNQRWRLNLEVLDREMPKIMDFPTVETQFLGRTLFLSGALSDYVQPAHRAVITGLFPKARFVAIKGATHWLHADKPQEFAITTKRWLNG